MAAQLDFIGLVAADMSKSLAFYRRLGLDIPPDTDGEDHVEVTLPSGIRIGWDSADNVRSFLPDWTPPSGGSRVSLAFRCDDPADVDRIYADLVDAGYDGYKEPWDAPWGQRYALVHDPDGNGVDLFAPLADQGS